MNAYVYVRSEPGLYTVGFYDPAGKWQPESDHESSETAADRVAWLNGAARKPYYCRCCGERSPSGRDCCSDDFPEPGDVREWS